MNGDDLLLQVLGMYERKDSICIGTSGKGGEMKVYFNSGDELGAKERIDRAASIRAYAAGVQKNWELMLKEMEVRP